MAEFPSYYLGINIIILFMRTNEPNKTSLTTIINTFKGGQFDFD
ncbi:hypothetical protein BMETH_652_0 [methanotrophic bacterial endosymbiont of Bathymodiolus sp.]|nr:hypothetical protein BMETH_652_0 [methanotrophic bacterial endosymbiont of Bathymodiolus sp.]